MPIFYKKTLECGCIIIALTAEKVDDGYLLGGHSYYVICNECKLNLSEETLDERLEDMYNNDNKISINYNNWIQIIK